eukprot:CAMPEP_0195524986 /NCGR_PEP_ID=MMETSP0794_2-20130614/25148_1 /TAXON_ID=515487 /ORGANISM="Stephanopyxis turris, Strain CCMP 815" /LENGTH=369 /DNA_ID=CAMNT_0040655337 /DNA_START=47 /DNA_END=1156 /DNA_ORIENTATION=-
MTPDSLSAGADVSVGSNPVSSRVDNDGNPRKDTVPPSSNKNAKKLAIGAALVGGLSVATISAGSGMTGAVQKEVFETEQPMENHPRAGLPLDPINSLDPLNMFRDVAQFPLSPFDVPFLWVTPRGGGTAVRDVMKQCYNLTSVRDLGIDTISPKGLQRMTEFRLISDERKDFFHSPFLHDAALVFTKKHHGRWFASFRHPNEEELSFFTLKKKGGDPDIQNMSFMDYLNSNLATSNWLTRFLVNKKTGQVTKDDFQRAQQIIRRKCLVLLADRKEESIKHLEAYFGWQDLQGWGCVDQMLKEDLEEEVNVAPWENSDEWAKCTELNQYDNMLYEYIQELYDVQGNLLQMDPPFGVPEDYSWYGNAGNKP